MKNVVAIYRSRYLPISETFIYEQIVHLQKYKAIVISSRPIINADIFPYSRVFRVRRAKAIIPLLKKRKARLIHARFGSGGVFMLPIKKRTNLPLLTSFHGSDLNRQLVRNGRYRRALPELFRCGDKFTVVSEYMKDQLRRLGCPKRKIEVLKSGVDLRKFPFQPAVPPSKDHAYRILTVGRLVEKKGTQYLIRAFARIRKKYPDTTLVIIGEGPRKAALQRLAERLRVADAIDWKGALPHAEVRKEMEKCDIFSLPSVTCKDGNQEGIPNVLIEAMALGRPVVATKHAGIPELVIHKKTGCLVPERDEKALAKMIMELMEHPERWLPVLKRAREHVEKEHDIRKQIRKLERIYDRLAGEIEKERHGRKRRKKGGKAGRKKKERNRGKRKKRIRKKRR
ncbi:glycosyltransferase [Bacillaceae bacterium]